MSDILTALLQGLSDYWTHFLSFLRKHIDYSSMVNSAEALNSVLGATILEDVKMPDQTVTCILQFVQNKGKWEVLFLNKRNKYLGNVFMEDNGLTSLTSLDTNKVYTINTSVHFYR